MRHTIRQSRRRLSPAKQDHARRQVAQAILSHPLYQQAQCVAWYLAIDGEIDPGLALYDAWQQKKTVALPVCDPHSKQLDFKRYTPQTTLQQTHHHLWSPPATNEPLARDDIDLILLPCVAVNVHGARMGYGHGYYDRTFERHTPPILGLIHACQWLPTWRHQAHDLRCNSLIIIDENASASKHLSW